MTTSYVIKEDESQSSLFRDKKLPFSELVIELTERCNNACIHCYINKSLYDFNAKNKELSTEDVKNIITEAASLGCMSVRFTGGEVFVRKDFEELYVFARKAGLRVGIFTNATYITRHWAELFSRIPPMEKIEVTVYGMHKESYEGVTRKPGTFEAFWQGVNLLLEYKIPFVVKSVILPSNKHEIEEFEAWAVTIPGMDKKLPRYSLYFQLRSRRDNQNKNKLIKKLRISTDEAMNMLTKRKDEYIRDMKQFLPQFTRPCGDKLFPCGIGCGGSVDSYGKFMPCQLLRHPDTVYDLKQGNLKDASDNFVPKVKEMKATNPEYLKRCGKCFLRGLCQQCPAMSYMEHGNLDTPIEYHCEITHAQARYLGILGENEKSWEVEDWKERIEKFVKS